jgi:hypothetical protein
VDLYFPDAHAVHAWPFWPEYPALHRQSAAASLPVVDCELEGQLSQVPTAVAPVVVEYVLSPQFVHAAEPTATLYFPGTHSTQVCPSSPVAPALQVQAVSTADPDGEFEFAGQTSQVGLPSADHPPAEHVWHVSTPVAPTAAE